MARTASWYKFQFTNVDESDFEQTWAAEESGGTAPATQSWHLSEFNYRKKITVQNANISSDLKDFPVLIAFDNDSDLNTLKMQADLDDLRFFDSNGLQLSFEIDSFTIDGSQASLRACVRKPLLKSSPSAGDNDVYMYYGNVSAVNASVPNDVWDKEYLAVWHFSEGSGGVTYDSSKNAYDLTINSASWSTSGRIGNAIDFNGTGENLNLQANVIEENGEVSLCFNSDIASGLSSSFTFMGVATATTYFRLQHWIDDQYYFGHVNNNTDYRVNFSAATMPVSSATWYSLNFDWVDGDGTTGSANVFLDGALAGSRSGYDVATPVGGLYVGSGGNGSHLYNGLLDEVRVSTGPRSSAWKTFESANIKEADFELTIDSEEIKP